VSPSIRLAAIDIDGTLLNSQFRISSVDLKALRRAREAGIEIVLVTGRRHAFALAIARELGFDMWLISSNGAVTRSLNGEPFHSDLLPRAVCRQFCSTMDEFRGHMVLTFDKESKGAVVLERMDELNVSIQRWLEKNMASIEFAVPLENALLTDPVQVMLCGTLNRMRQAMEHLEGSAVRNSITLLRTEYPARDLIILDVLNRGCSKGHALERWARHRGIAREEVMAIGDNYNDVEMLAFAGVPFIMGNASEELKSRGWQVSLSNDEHGVAAALAQVLASSRSEVSATAPGQAF
jgi:Cof subfamily protein (haloacid dehalogenase superfamily)